VWVIDTLGELDRLVVWELDTNDVCDRVYNGLDDGITDKDERGVKLLDSKLVPEKLCKVVWDTDILGV